MPVNFSDDSLFYFRIEMIYQGLFNGCDFINRGLLKTIPPLPLRFSQLYPQKT